MTETTPFKFELGEKVTLETNGQDAEVTSRSQYETKENSYEIICTSYHGQRFSLTQNESQLRANKITPGKNIFKFELNQAVTINASGETGEITGRAQYKSDQNRYYIHYKAADGTATEKWWDEDRLTARI